MKPEAGDLQSVYASALAKRISLHTVPPKSRPGVRATISQFLGISPQHFRRPAWDIGDASCQISRRSVNFRRRKLCPNKKTKKQ